MEKGENSFVLLQLLEANLPQVYGKVGNPDGAVRLGNQGQGGLSVFPPDHVYYCSNLRSEGDSNSSNLLCHNLPQDSIRLLDQHTLQCYLLSILLNKKGLLFENIRSASLLKLYINNYLHLFRSPKLLATLRLALLLQGSSSKETWLCNFKV